MDKTQIIEALKSMTILEINELVKALEEEFGVSAVAVAAPAAGGAAAAEEEEKSEFNVVLKEIGQYRTRTEGSKGCRRRSSYSCKGRRTA